MDDHQKTERAETERRFAGLKIQPANMFFSQPIPPIDWLVKGMVEAKTVTMLAGAPKTAKSWFALEMALSVSTGTNMFDDPLLMGPADARPVLSFLLEDSPHSINSRIRAMAQAKQVHDPVDLDMYFRFGGGLNLAENSCALQLAEDIKHNLPPLGLITFDPFRNLHTGDENDSGAITQIMDNLRRIRDITGAAILVVHHTRKPTASDKANPGFSVRGSGAIYGSVDGLITMMNVSSIEDDRDIFKNNVFCRVKAGRESKPFSVELRIYDDENGRANKTRWKTGGVF